VQASEKIVVAKRGSMLEVFEHNPDSPLLENESLYVLAKSPTAQPTLGVMLAEHILAMADDTYLTGHPEWYEIVADAERVVGMSRAEWIANNRE